MKKYSKEFEVDLYRYLRYSFRFRAIILSFCIYFNLEY